jgi:rhodanese-related sulfurtransferase
MKWKQFFTPVTSIDSEKAKALTRSWNNDDYTYLDVRQPKEYEKGHLPGAKLIPFGELDRRLEELDQNKPIIIY